MTERRSVIVIGAGLAGLAATRSLRSRGIDVLALEATSHPGGRVARREINGFQVDLGANLFMETYGTAKRMAEELGTPLRRTRVPIHSGIYRNGRFHGLYGDNRPANLLRTARTILSFGLLPPKGVWQMVKFAGMLRTRSAELSFDDHERLLDLDTGESASEFFETRIGTEALDWMFGPGLSGYAFAYPEQVGAAFALTTLWHAGLNGVAWPCLPDGGIGSFLDALADECDGALRLSTPVRRIEIEDSAARGVVTEHGFMGADAVICATTATEALRIAPDLPAAVGGALRRVTYSRCCRVFYGVDSSPLPRDWYAVAIPRQTGSTVIGMSNAAVLAPETVPAGKAIIDALVIDRHADELFALGDDEVQERVLSEVRRHLPEMPRKPLFACVHRWREASCLAPGGAMSALHRVRQHELKDVAGLFLAGDYMSVPSTNGALRSGLDAAEEAAEFIG